MDNKYAGNMTKITIGAFRKATAEIGTKEEAVAFLKNELVTRNVRSIIEKFSDGRDIKVIQKLLVDGLMENHEGMMKESVERRVRGWLNPKSTHTIRKACKQ